jgi:AcrR family transcriptional regulator
MRVTENPFDGTKLKILQRVRTIFLTRGYHAPTMTDMADEFGLTRRALYHHFHSKQELFRAMIVLGNIEARELADWTAQKALAHNESALDIVAAWLDSRFGNTRRALGRISHGEELNQVAYSMCNDIMIEVSQDSNTRLAALLDELCRRDKLTLKPGRSIKELAQIIGDGARGVNQQRPPVPPGEIASRYRRIAEAILYGWTLPEAMAKGASAPPGQA